MSPYAADAKGEEIIFPYKNNGKEVGFLACVEEEFIFKPDKYSAATIRLERLKTNLRAMVKSKQARLIKAGTIEAVAVPRAKFDELYK
jgi:hypothetical protein